jgi:hypothetical protein
MRRVAGLALALVVASAGLATRPAADAPARPPSRLLVTATEFRFALSRTTLPPGAAHLQLANRGEDAHDLVVRRLDSTGHATGRASRAAGTSPDGTSDLIVTLQPGRYVLWCSVPGHRKLGMQARLSVRR